MKPIRLRTNAKLNLFLHVLGKRADGYHEIETIFHGIGLHDDIVFTPTDSGVDIGMRFENETFEGMPPAEDNLIARVADRLVAHGARRTGVRAEITKRIPIGAGLGGGSTNAAGALVALNELWSAGLSGHELERIAADIGTDVPYCLSGGTALATSRGDELTPLPAPAAMHFVLGLSAEPLYTRDVYPLWDPGAHGGDATSAAMTLALGGGDVAEVAALLRNDLEPAVFKLRPELEAKKEVFLAAGALGGLVTGSGPTIFAIARDAQDARRLASEVETQFDRTAVVASRSQAVERR